MDGLRWILLVAGILLVVGVFLFSRRQAGKAASRPSAPGGEGRVEPVINTPGAGGVDPDRGGRSDAETDADGAVQVDIEELVQPGGDASAATPAGLDEGTVSEESVDTPDAPQKIVTVRIVAREDGSFRGDQLVLSLRGIGLRHGRFGIFHRYDGNDEKRIVFSAASLVEPGSFDLENLKEQSLPGISLFMVLPGPVDGTKAFDAMMTAARTLTTSLDGELLDESGSTLSIQRERYLREEIIEYQLASGRV